MEHTFKLAFWGSYLKHISLNVLTCFCFIYYSSHKKAFIWHLFPWGKAVVCMCVLCMWVRTNKYGPKSMCVCPFSLVPVNSRHRCLLSLFYSPLTQGRKNNSCWTPVFRNFAFRLQKEATKTKYKMFSLSWLSPVCNLKAEVSDGTIKGWVVNLWDLLKLWSSVGET